MNAPKDGKQHSSPCSPEGQSRFFDETWDASPHTLASFRTANVDMTVVRVPHEAMASPLKFAVHFIQHQIREQR
jgi:hypothetical protein